MRSLVNLFLLVVLSTFFSCEKGKSDLSGTYQLIENTPVSFSKGNQTLSVAASNLIDSRCPANVNCVWEGYAATDLLITTNETENKIKLCTGGCNVMKLNKEETITFNGIAYRIQLKDIAISTSNQKTAVIELQKK